MRAARAGWVAVFLAAGCASSPAPGGTSTLAGPGVTPSSAVATGERLDCNAIGDDRPTAGSLVVLDGVALPSPRAPALQTSRQQSPPSPLQAYFAKTGLGFKAGTAWRLTVAPEDEGHLRIGWGSPAAPSLGVSPPDTCSPPSRTGWLWYPGGYWTDLPGCYAVVVHVGERTQRVSVGVGAPCPGQPPPPAPSDA